MHDARVDRWMDGMMRRLMRVIIGANSKYWRDDNGDVSLDIMIHQSTIVMHMIII